VTGQRADDRLSSLERRGLIRRGTGEVPACLRDGRRPKRRARRASGVLRLLLRDRKMGW